MSGVTAFLRTNCVPEPLVRRNAPLPGQKPDAQTRQCSSTAARTGHCLTKARCSLCRRGAHSGRSAVADNTLIIKQKSILPVGKTRQDKSLFRSLSDTYLPPVGQTAYIASALQPPRPHGHPPHLRHYYLPPTSACARHPFYMTTCAAATAACGPGAKMSLAYATGPFSVPHCPAGASRTTGALILYGTSGTAVT